MTLQWILVGASLLVAVAAFAWARRLSTRLERLSQSYWELRYDHGQLSARLSRLEPRDETTAGEPKPPAQTAFVPLSSLKK